MGFLGLRCMVLQVFQGLKPPYPWKTCKTMQYRCLNPDFCLSKRPKFGKVEKPCIAVAIEELGETV